MRNLLTVCCFASLLVGCSSFTRSSLQIEAKIIYNMGGPQSVARTSFYLIDVDPLTIRADDPAVKTSRGGKNLADAGLLSEATFLLFAKVLKEDKVSDDNAKQFLGIIEAGKSLWGPHLVNETRTDFDGKATFAGLKPGSYWLLGMTETRKGFCLRDLNVQIIAVKIRCYSISTTPCPVGEGFTRKEHHS
jgi:hypothetical protein